MAKNTGKVREKSGNFVSPEKWEPWVLMHMHRLPVVKYIDYSKAENKIDLETSCQENKNTPKIA